MSELERLQAENARLREALESVATEFEQTVAHIDSKGKGGQHVPFHGDFASACQLPSFCSRARWWATHLRAALTAQDSSEWLRAFATRAVEAGDQNVDGGSVGDAKRIRPLTEVVEEVLNGKA